MAQGKPPAFQCYAKEALTTTSAMTLAESGAWAKLRWWTWMNGPLPLDRLHLILGVSPAAARKLWTAIKGSWSESAAGWVSPDLEEQREARRQYHEAQAAKAAAGGRARAESIRRARGHFVDPAQTVPAGMPTGTPLGNPPACPTCAPAFCSCDLQSTQLHEDQPLRGPVVAENDNPKVLVKLAHTVIDEQMNGAFAEDDIEEVFEQRASRLRLNYSGDRTRKALESAKAQRMNGDRGAALS